MHVRPYEKLIAWREAHQLTLRVYRFARDFPDEERFGLTSQMRRSSSSVPMNIVEGIAKRSYREKACYLERALASLEELHYQCVLSRDLSYLSIHNFDLCIDHIRRTSYLIMKLRASFEKK